ncbi:MAG TPA: three-Cys-motif partner protein TcmP [Reyranella sp.]|nr:three-Cys-motif partner protein TcmP [Reyranella sp.]
MVGLPSSSQELGETIDFTPDEIGEWSERKIRIVSKFAMAHTTILHAHKLKRFYIDGHCGGGLALRKGTLDPVVTTGARILEITPPFTGYHLIDADPNKAAAMRRLCEARPNATAHCGDSNTLLPLILKTIRYDKFERALCFIDPYNISVPWDVIVSAARTGVTDLFLHFPTGDVQRNVLRHDLRKVAPSYIALMNMMWGDESWRFAAYATEPDLFGPVTVKQPIDNLLWAFTSRMKEAGFAYVSKPLPMRNSTNAIIYHLIFATQQAVALKVANDILSAESMPGDQWRTGRVSSGQSRHGTR